jgi:hypothetical protein
MTETDTHQGATAGSGSHPSWYWATVLSVQPGLATTAVVGMLLFGVTSAVTTPLQLPKHLPLLPGVPTLIVLGAAYVYTPVYVFALLRDIRAVRAATTAWTPPWWALLGGGSQTTYFMIPLAQAYGIGGFDELIFGVVEFAALIGTAIVTTRYLSVRVTRTSDPPRLVSLWVRIRAAASRRSG